MLNQKDLSEKMSKDIDEMEKMLNDYLQFAKTQSQEETTEINLKELFSSIQENFSTKKLEISVDNNIILNGRPVALKRSFENIIQNALTYGKKAFINVQKSSNRVLVTVEDDGPGIPEEQYKNVFKPFLGLIKVGV